MKHACIRKCQYRNNTNKVRLASVGDVVELDKKPFESNWTALDALEIDFLVMSEAELTEVSWKFSDAFTAVKDEYDVELKKTTKDDIIKQILDARFRQVI